MSSSTSSGYTDDQPELDLSQFDEPVQFVVDRGFLPAQQVDLLKFLREEDGATAVEYAVMISLIAATCIAGFQTLTSATLESFETSADELAQ